MKRIFGFLTAFSFICVQATAGTTEGLKTAFEELNYNLSVEWDQKDQNFYDQEMKKFASELKSLKAQGLTNTEIVAFVKSEMKNEKVAKDLETAFSMIQVNQMTLDEASSYMIESLKMARSTGANWSASTHLAFSAVFSVLVLAAIIVAPVPTHARYCVDYLQCDAYGGNCYYVCR